MGRRWTAEDMDEFLNEFVTFEAQVAHRNELFVERKDPNHADHGEPLPIQIRPSDVMLWRICFAQAHSDVARKHFADAGGDLEADSEAQSSEQVARFYDQWEDELKQMSDYFDRCSKSDERALVKRMLQVFEHLDVDNSGEVSRNEISNDIFH